MDETMAKRAFTRGAGIGAAILFLALLLPGAAMAGLSGDEDSYAYPLIGKFSRTDSGPGISLKEKGDNYGAGVFFRMPFGSRMVGSPNVEATTEVDRRFIANVRFELDFIKADVTASGDNVLSQGTTYRETTSADAKTEAKYRIARGEGDVGYRIKMGATSSVEPFLGLGFIYSTRDLDSAAGVGGHSTYSKILDGKVGFRGEFDLGDDMLLFGEIGMRLPLYTRIKENLAPSVSFSPGMAMSDSETVGFRYAQYRIFLFHERMAFKEGTSGGGMIRPETKEDTVGLRIGIGY